MLAAARTDPVGLIRELDQVTIDEIQRAPGLMLAIKQSVDLDRRPGRFLLTGSANILTARHIQDSMAGRIETLTLLPLSQDEIRAQGRANFLDQLFEEKPVPHNGPVKPNLVSMVLTGGYPEVLARQNTRRQRDWLAAYVKSVIERDMPDIATIDRSIDMPRFIAMLALLNGQLINQSELGARLGIDRKTAARYLGLLEQLFLLRRLPAWTNNALKRLVKTPKLHFIDSGLAAHLQGITVDSLSKDRSHLGNLLESFVLAELEKQSGWSDGRYIFSHYRDKDGVEVDIVIENDAQQLIGIEIKAAATVTAADFAGLRRLAASNANMIVGIVLYDGEHVLPFGSGLKAMPLSAVWTV